MTRTQSLGILSAFVLALTLVPAANAVGLDAESEIGVGGSSDDEARTEIHVTFHDDAVGFDVESSTDLANITVEACFGYTVEIGFEAGMNSYTHEGVHLIVGVWVNAGAAEEGSYGAGAYFDNDVECSAEDPAGNEEDPAGNETDDAGGAGGTGGGAGGAGGEVSAGIGGTVGGDASVGYGPEGACPGLHATTHGDGSISIHAEGRSEGAVLLRAAGDGPSQEIAAFEASDGLHTDIDTEADVTYTYTLVVDGEVCGLVEVTAIPVFPGVLAGAFAIGGPLLAYVGIRRFL